MSETASNALSQALARLWTQHLPEIESRVAVLEACSHALSSGSSTDEALNNAASAAHKLAGVLGTFGLQQGTDLAREAETLCTEAVTSPSALASRIAAIAQSLRTLIAEKQ